MPIKRFINVQVRSKAAIFYRTEPNKKIKEKN